MAERKTSLNDQDPIQYLNRIANEEKRNDSFDIMELMQTATGEEPKMCRVVEKHEGVIIAIFPEEEKYIYLDKVYDIWKWQKVKDFERE